MRCPYCGSSKNKVVDKRDQIEDGFTRRRRECLKCYKRYTTYERVENVELDVMKRDGSIERFDKEKLRRSISKAISKRPIDETQTAKIIEDIEMKLLNRKDKTIRSSEIGKMVLNRLLWLDGIAYMRFASVYKEFESLEDFSNEINLLKDYYDKKKKGAQNG